ncbi:hypothetical protein [Winogradskya humida]|uniref:Uncharacterized protein n=1 Tax=Winogradskya humida TaxID=113566 RepID=A0ABQ4A4Y9_9ACTN|nr:hypothetical protein [Actinoplanes humidus]GIE25919.1 hypothetical protein Ahu01nite_090210 [Actinoplanes humidus]
MPRKRPSILRQTSLPKTLWHDVPHVPGVDKRSQHEISGIEWRTAQDWARGGLWPGAVGEALKAWQQIVEQPRTRVFLPCACCGRHPRALLQEAMDGLTTPTARRLLNLIGPLDDDFRRHTRMDPHQPGGSPWWEQRLPLHD